MKKVLIAHSSRTGKTEAMANLAGKVGGAFGSHTHSGESAPMIYDTMRHVFKMDMTNLGPLNLTEVVVGTDEGLKACQDYGRAIGVQFS